MISKTTIAWFTLFVLGASLVSGVAQEHKTMTGQMETNQDRHVAMHSSLKPEHQADDLHHPMDAHKMPSHDHEKMTEMAASKLPPEADMAAFVRIDERLGDFIDFSGRIHNFFNPSIRLRETNREEARVNTGTIRSDMPDLFLIINFYSMCSE